MSNPVEEHHADVRRKISAGEEGYAQSDVEGQIVSYSAPHYPGTMTHSFPISKGIGQILEEMILDVARDEGIASPKTFSRDRAEWMVRDRLAYPSYWKKKHKEAALVQMLLANQPDLFR